MRTISSGSILALLIFLSGLCPAASAQLRRHVQPALDSKTTWIVLGSAYGTPGEFVVIPLRFQLAEGTQVGRLKLEVTFPSAYLKFEKLERGIASDVGNLILNSEVTPGKAGTGDENSKLTILGSLLPLSSSNEPRSKTVPAGSLATLTFRIAEDWGPTTIQLKTSGEATEPGSNMPLKKFQTIDGTVDLLVPGGMGCFFFSH